MGPGLQGELPVLNQNNAGTSRARAEIQRAARQYIVIKHNITREVMEACQNYLSAQKIFNTLQNDIIPPSDSAAVNGEKAYLIGEISYLEYLVFKERLLNVKLRFVDAEADLRRSTAQLRYCTGSNEILLQ
jgi:cobalt-zinc-cadmium efflux system outer membrane protein